MPRYGFSCDRCGQEHEISCSWSQRPSTLPCKCGSEATPRITGGRAVFIKGSEMVYDQKYTIPNMGWHVGRSNQKQAELYENVVGTAKRKAKERRKSLSRKSDDQWEHVGKMPLEIHEYITESTGDPHTVARDPEYWLKKTGTWLGE